MFKALRRKLANWIQPSVEKDSQAVESVHELEVVAEPTGNAPLTFVAHGIAAYDDGLYERARTQWHFGDWASLARMEQGQLLDHPERARLALMVASGHLQLGNKPVAREWIKLAQDWGCSRKLLSQVLIAGVHNSLGRAAVAAKQEEKALEHFEASLRVGSPGAEARLLARARASEQLAQLSLSRTSSPPHMSTSSGKVLRPASKQALPAAEAASQKSYGDADIDDFISDMAPFFKNKLVTYVDVGAYVGEVFLKLINCGEIRIREAHLIEPNPASYELLKKNLEGIAPISLHTYNCAVSADVGIAKFVAAKSMTKQVPKGGLVGHENVFEAECRSLSQFESAITDKKIGLLKVDVEGEEISVLKSAVGFLESQRVDVIYIEVGLNKEGTQQTYLGEVDAFLQEYGYRIFRIYEQKNEWIDDSPLLRRCNAAYMSSRFAAANPYKSTLETYQRQK